MRSNPCAHPVWRHVHSKNGTKFDFLPALILTKLTSSCINFYILTYNSVCKIEIFSSVLSHFPTFQNASLKSLCALWICNFLNLTIQISNSVFDRTVHSGLSLTFTHIPKVGNCQSYAARFSWLALNSVANTAVYSLNWATLRLPVADQKIAAWLA